MSYQYLSCTDPLSSGALERARSLPPPTRTTTAHPRIDPLVDDVVVENLRLLRARVQQQAAGRHVHANPAASAHARPSPRPVHRLAAAAAVLATAEPAARSAAKAVVCRQKMGVRSHGLAHPQAKVKTSFLGISGSAKTMGRVFVREKNAMMPNSTPNCHQLANRLFRWEKMDPVTQCRHRGGVGGAGGWRGGPQGE